jgi:hypothetical protein
MPKPFVAHAVILTERTTPMQGQIWAACLVGAERIFRLDLDTHLPSATFVRQCLAKLPTKVVAFGAVKGFVLNYKSDFAVEYDTEGRPLAVLDQAASLPGRAASLKVGGMSLTVH